MHGEMSHEKKGEPEELAQRRKKVHPTKDMAKAPAEGVKSQAGLGVAASMEEHAAILRSASGEQGANMVIQLQQSYGNAYVQRVVERIEAESSSLEAEADAIGGAVANGESVAIGRAAGAPAIQFQRTEPIGEPKKPAKSTSDYKEALGKTLEAVMATDMGKNVKERLKKAATTKEGVAVLSAMAVPAIAAAFANKMDVPQGLVDLVPKVAKIEPGKDMEISLKPIYKGKFGEKPKEWGGMVTFTMKW